MMCMKGRDRRFIGPVVGVTVHLHFMPTEQADQDLHSTAFRSPT